MRRPVKLKDHKEVGNHISRLDCGIEQMTMPSRDDITFSSCTNADRKHGVKQESYVPGTLAIPFLWRVAERFEVHCIMPPIMNAAADTCQIA